MATAFRSFTSGDVRGVSIYVDASIARFRSKFFLEEDLNHGVTESLSSFG